MIPLLGTIKQHPVWTAALAAAFVLLYGTAAESAEFTPTMKDICAPNPLSGAPSEVDRRRVLGLFLKSIGISEIDMRSDGGDLSYEQKVDFALHSLTFLQGEGEQRKCVASWGDCSVKAALQADGNRAPLTTFLIAHGAETSRNDSGIHIVARDPNDQMNVKKFLLDLTAFTTACVVKETDAAAIAQDPKSNKLIKNLAGRLSIRNKVQDLRYAQASTDSRGSIARPFPSTTISMATARSSGSRASPASDQVATIWGAVHTAS